MARDLARRSGMTLGEWLNQMIVEGLERGAAALRVARRVRRPNRSAFDRYAGARPAAPAPARDSGDLEVARAAGRPGWKPPNTARPWPSAASTSR